jgi:cytochrome P450
MIDFAFDPLPGAELHGALAALRSAGPIVPCRFGGQPAFLITTRALLEEAFRDVERLPPARLYQNSIARTIGENFQSMEGARHHLYRRIATPAFRSRAIERYGEEGMRELAREVIDRFRERPTVDLVDVFTHRFPFLVISRLLGVPRAQEEKFHQWAHELLGPPGVSRADSLRATQEFEAVIQPSIEARREKPTDDVISELVHSEVEGTRLSSEQIASHVKLMFAAGATTTCDALGNLIHALLLDGGRAWREVLEVPDLRAGAIHEALRWEPPVANLPRLSAPHGVDFGGVEIPPSSLVLMSMAAANRDPAVYPEPDRFDPRRPVSDLLTFGRGERSCPGMHLARRSLRVALDALLDAFPELAHQGEVTASAPRGATLRGPARLPVELGPPLERAS